MSETAASAEATAPARLPIPYTFLAGRAAIAVITFLLIVFICAGFAGWGPGHNLVSLTHKAFHWIDSWSGLNLQ
jgi:hypothetical protein